MVKEENLIRTKADVQEVTARQIELWSAGQEGFTDRYCQAAVREFRQFSRIIERSPLFDAPEGWNYAIEIRGTGICLTVQKTMNDPGERNLDQNPAVYELLQARAELMTVEEYAALHEITHVAAVSRIRRGKIRCALKQGRDWRIPSLALPVEKGYRPATYIWIGKLQGLPGKFEVINQYARADFFQDDSILTRFHVRFTGNDEEPLEIICNRDQRGSIERIFVSNPDVRCLTDVIMCINRKTGSCTKEESVEIQREPIEYLDKSEGGNN